MHGRSTKVQLWISPVWGNVGVNWSMALQGSRGEVGKMQMLKVNRRRSPRRALELAIRIFGTDFRGKDFVEDSTTLEVNQHGAKIRLTSQLIPEQEIRILCQGNNREGLFRVARQVGEPVGEFSSWGVECLNPSENIWEVARLAERLICGSGPPFRAGDPSRPLIMILAHLQSRACGTAPRRVALSSTPRPESSRPSDRPAVRDERLPPADRAPASTSRPSAR